MMRWAVIQFLAVTCLALGAEPPREAEIRELRGLLGTEFSGAKFVAIRNQYVVVVDLEALQVRELGEFPAGKRFENLSRPRFSPDGQKIIFAHKRKCYTVNTDGSGQRQVLADQKAVYSPDWWQDPDTGELCIVFMNANGKHWYREGKPSPGATFLFRTASGKIEQIAKFPCDGGLSGDGTHLGEAYGGCLIVDVVNQTYHRVQEKQACNATMSPDNTYRMMYLYLPHKYFGIRNKHGKELWRITNPEGSQEWQTPRWSNHPNLCMATLKIGEYFPVVIKIDSKSLIVLRSLGGGWRAPHQWLPRAAAARAAAAGPLRDLKLVRLKDYRKRLARAASYTPVIQELKLMRAEPEAELIVRTLEEAARTKLRQADSLADAIEAKAIYAEVAANYDGMPFGQQANAVLHSETFARELEAASVQRELLALEQRLQPVDNAQANFSSRRFLGRNQAALVQMVGLAGRLRHEFNGTRAAVAATAIRDKYGLPAVTKVTGNVFLEIEATVEAASPVSSAAQIAPYTASVTWIRYKVDKVLKGKYDAPSIVVVHWGMVGAEPTPAASWRPGTKQRLEIDLFQAHPELAHATASQDAYLGYEQLTEYWALKVETLHVPLASLKDWPASREGLLYVWQDAHTLNQFTPAGGGKPKSFRPAARGRARFEPAGAMQLAQGAYVVQNIGPELLEACAKTDELTVEAQFRPADLRQRGPARIVSFSKDASRRNFTLGQDRDKLIFRLRTTKTDPNGSKPQTTLCPATDKRTQHLIVAYKPGRLVCYLNGELVLETEKVQGTLDNWENCTLLFGDEANGSRDWAGSLDHIAIFNRFMDEDEAKEEYQAAGARP